MIRAARTVALTPRPLVVAAIVASLTLAIGLQWDAIATFDWRLAWLPFVGAVAIFAVCPLAGAVAFWLLIRDLTGCARLGPCTSVWARSFAARYVPTGALTVAVRIVERERVGATRRQIVSATVWEQVAAGLTAAAVALVAFAAAGRMPPSTVLAVLTGAVPLVGGGYWILRRRFDALYIAHPRALAAASAVSAAGWLAAGTAAWLFIGSIAGGGAPGFFFVVGGFAAAWLAGFVIPFAPSGLGAREAVLVGVLAPAVGAAAATALAVGLRLAGIAADLVVVAGVESAGLLGRRSTTPRREAVAS